ncbi:hypothetical protein [Pseudonocardia alni]
MGAPSSVIADDERARPTAFVEEYRTLLDGPAEEQARRQPVPSATT